MPQKQKFPHLVGSKWTARQKIDGWRHFQVVNRKNEGKWVFAELVAACDPQVRFWVNAQVLRHRRTWEAGWKSLGDRRADAPRADAPIAESHPIANAFLTDALLTDALRSDALLTNAVVELTGL